MEREYLDVEADNGEKYTVFINSVLSSLIENEGIEVGDRIAIKYLGLHESKKSKRQYKSYVIVKE